MVLYVVVAAPVVWWYFWRQSGVAAVRDPSFPLLLTFSSLLAFRILMNMSTWGYPIYYNGPVALSFLLLLRLDHPSSRPLAPVRVPGRISDLSRVFSAGRALHLCIRSPRQNFVPLTTEREQSGIETFG